MTVETHQVGSAVVLPDGRRIELVRAEPYTRVDGSPSVVLHWRAACAVCGGPFEATSGRNPLASSALMNSKRCPAHRMTREQWLDICRKKGEAGRKRKEALKASRAAERAARKAARQATLESRKAASSPLGHPRRKLSDTDVAEIRRLHAEGLSSRDLAVVFPVSDSAIRNILRGARRAG